MKTETSPSHSPDSSFERFSPEGKLDVILGLFGSEKARQNFISLCEEYNMERTRSRILPDDAEGSGLKKAKISYSPPKRAHLHNMIMEIIGKLAIQFENPTPLQKKVLGELHSRENVAEAIRAYIINERGAGQEDGEREIRENTKSPTAYFHFLNKGN